MLKYFFNFVEIRTKIVSIISFFYTLSIMLYFDMKLDFLSLFIFFCSMLLFDMSVTAINSYYAISKEINLTSADDFLITEMRLLKLSQKDNLAIIFVLLILSTALGVNLIHLNTILILFYGVFCFAIGILYSYGPLPICRTFLGEIVSGFAMGIMIPLIILALNDVYIFNIDFINISLNFKMNTIFHFAILFFPLAITIANIMLANNISDMEKDFSNKRYTLPVLVGFKNANLIYRLDYLLIIILITLGIILNIFPLLSIIIVLYLCFKSKYKVIPHDKKHNMHVALSQFVTINLAMMIVFLIS